MTCFFKDGRLSFVNDGSFFQFFGSRGIELAGRRKNPVQTEATRMTFLETAFELFSSKSIETVSMVEIAKESGYGTITLYRYFSTKPALVVAVAAWKWGGFLNENRKRNPSIAKDATTAAEDFEFYLYSFLNLYEKHRAMLRFNQYFNIYVQSEHISSEVMAPYQKIIENIKGRFHIIYEKAKKDKTLRTDIPEEEMFSTTLHLMLATVTRYAVGLVYIPEDDNFDQKELLALKEMLMDRYRGIVYGK